ncbi:MAG: DUF2341 domain-containing protein [Cellulophaga sp.]
MVFIPSFAWRSEYSSWNYVENQTVIADDTNQTDYHVTFVRDTAAMISSGYLEADGDDLRFWMENFTHDINGDFEGDSLGADPSGWVVQDGGVNGVVEVSSTQAHSGTKSVKMTDNSGSGYPAMKWETVKPRPSNDAIYSGWIYVDELTAGTVGPYFTLFDQDDHYGPQFGFNISLGVMLWQEGIGETMTNGTFSLDTWVNWKVKKNSYTYTYDLWIDDAYLGNFKYRQLGGTAEELTRLWFSGGGPLEGVWYEDDFSIISEGGQLDYFIHPDYPINTNDTRIIVETPILLKEANRTIEMYYGYSSASQDSNCQETFPTCDLFDDASINTELWNVTSGSPTEGGGIFDLSRSGTDIKVHTNRYFYGNEYILEYDGWHEDTNYNIVGYGTAGLSLILLNQRFTPGNMTIRINNTVDTALGKVDEYFAPFSQWATYEVRRHTNSSIYVDGVLQAYTDTYAPDAQPMSIRLWDYNTNQNLSINWLMVMHKSSDEPTIYYGAQESQDAMSVSIIAPTTGTYYTQSTSANISLYWPESDATNYTLAIYLNDGELTNWTGSMTNGTLYFNLPTIDLYDGIFNLTANATETFSSTTVTNSQILTIDLYDLAITSPAAGGTYNTINVTYNASCRWSFGNVTIAYQENETSYGSISKACPFSSEILSTTRQSAVEGNRTIGIVMQPINASEAYQNVSVWYYSDIYNPTGNWSKTLYQGFRNNITESYTFQFNDSFATNLSCEVNINSNSYNATFTNTTTYVYNYTLNDGTNNMTVNCTDLAGNYAYISDTSTVYTKYYMLIDEDTGLNFTLSNANVTVFAINNGISFDFNTENQTYFYWTSNSTDSLRFEQTYEGYSDVIVRNFDVGLSYPITPVCANELSTFAEQIFYSTENKAVYVVSQYTGCYIVSDYTQYAFETALMTFAHTIDQIYYLYIIDDDELVFLSALNGATASQVNLDVLQYNSEGFTLDASEEFLSISKLANTTFYIYYGNPDNDNTALTVTIKNGTSTIFSVTETSDPNDFALYFDYTTIGLSSESTITVTATATKTNGDTSTVTKALTLIGKTGDLPKELTIILSAMLVIFGVTFVSMGLVSGWFGVVTGLISVAILSFSPPSWEITFMQGIMLIITLFLGLMGGSGVKKLT